MGVADADPLTLGIGPVASVVLSVIQRPENREGCIWVLCIVIGVPAALAC